MDKITLVIPGPEHEQAALAYRSEHFNNGEYDLHGSSLFDKAESYSEWLKDVLQNRNPKTANRDWVPSSTFFGVRGSDGAIVGMIDIRHKLNGLLAAWGGHIGYGVRPSQRRKGYAGQMLALALDEARALGLTRVMLSCNSNNTASANTIKAAGGVLERNTTDDDGKPVDVYWIAL